MKRCMLGGRLALLALALAACSACTTAKVSGSWISEDYSRGALTSVLVLGASSQDLARRIFESDMTERLRQLDVAARSAHALFPEEDPLKKDAILKLAEEQGIETLLVTRVTRKDRTTETRTYATGGIYYTPRFYLPYHHYPYYYDWYGYYSGFGATTLTTETYNYLVLNLEANLYDIAKGELIWTTALETVYSDNLTATIKDVDRVIVQQLQKDGLVRR